jgi:hypothetical protein
MEAGTSKVASEFVTTQLRISDAIAKQDSLPTLDPTEKIIAQTDAAGECGAGFTQGAPHRIASCAWPPSPPRRVLPALP